jgi:capsular exopolysaccharide synthesis family protein
MNPNREDGIQISDLATIAKRRWRLILFCIAGVFAVSVAVTWRQPRIYQSSTRVMMGQTLVRALLPEQTNPYESYFLQRLSFETQLHVIKSDLVAQRVVTRLKLVPAEAKRATFEAAAQRVKNAIWVERLPDTRLFDIQAVDSDPSRAQAMANATAEVYIAMNEERKLETTRTSIAWLTQELATLEEKIRRLDEELIDYLQEKKVEAPEVAGLGSGKGAGDEALLTNRSSVGPLRSQLTAAEIELNRLLQRYLDKHPKVVAKRSEIQTLKLKISEDVEKSSEQNKQLIQYNIKRRESELNKEMMILLMKKLKEMDLTGGLSENNITVVEFAQLPAAPISPNKRRNLILGGVLGLILGIGLALYREVFDRTVQTAEDAERYLKMPVLASVFYVRDEEKSGSSFTMVARHPSSPESEMFRTLRTNIKYSRPDGALHSILITSSGPEEGKSTISSNLAITLARGMKKTVIIDTDFRKPRQHKVFGCKNTKGMVEVLVGEEEIEGVLQKTSVNNLFLIPRGSNPPNPAELLDSDKMRETLNALKERFDYIIFDSPPVGSVVDASILGGIVDGTVLIVETGKFDARIIQRTREQLEKARGRIVGIVLNKNRRERLGYYYRHYYAYKPSSQEGAASS